jgi:hypothetical protein
MATYAEDRAVRINLAELGKRVGPVINNTGHSRQVRRRRERQMDDAKLSRRFLEACAKAGPEQGFFMTRRLGASVYVPADIGTTRLPYADYSTRYSSLFFLPTGAPDS